MKTLVIDNEKDIRQSLVDLLHAFCPDITIIEQADSILTGIQKINQFKPDIVFLDVELNEGTGFDLLRKLDDYSFQLIFVTAHNKYAVEAFRFSAIDFLVKPFDPELLMISVERAKREVKKEEMNKQVQFLLEQMQDKPKKDKIVLRSSDAIHFVSFSEIIYLEADANYTKFILDNNRNILVSGNLKEYESILESQNFIRTHHSFLVNLKKVKSFDKKNDELILENQMKVPVSTRKKDFILEKLDQI
jgi:two-component system LytT family response regulator